MGRMSYNITKRYNHALLKASHRLPGAVDVICKKSAEDGRDFAVQVCAKDTTRLSRTIRVVMIRQSSYRLVAGGIAGFDGVFVDYGPFVEKEQPFMHPAMQIVKTNLLSRMRSLQRFIGE